MNKIKYPKLIGKCIKCLGCNRLELENFKGTYRCENYIKGVTNERVDRKNY